MTDLTVHRPAEVGTYQPDPTGGRLVAWAEAASAANQLARALSQTSFVPKEMTNVGNATAAILAGDELGLSPLAALRSIYVVHGTPALYARSMVALALSQGHEIWTEVSTDQKVVVCGRRRGTEHVERSEWTITRAQKAKYTTNQKYSTNPQEMLYSKAAAEIARKIAPDVLAGMPYSVEDIELDEPATAAVSRPAATKRTVSRKAPEPVAPPLEPAEPPLDAEAGVAGEAEPDAAAADDPVTPDAITSAQLKKIGALMREQGITDRDTALAYVAKVIGREVASRNDLTKAEASTVIDDLSGETTPEPDPWAETEAAVAARDEQEAAPTT